MIIFLLSYLRLINSSSYDWKVLTCSCQLIPNDCEDYPTGVNNLNVYTCSINKSNSYSLDYRVESLNDLPLLSPKEALETNRGTSETCRCLPRPQMTLLIHGEFL